MINKKSLKEMFNFTTNKNKTIMISIIIFIQSLPYLYFYQKILSLVVDNYMPNKNLRMVYILSAILLLIIVISFVFDYYSETRRKICCYDNDRQIKNRIFKVIQYASISDLDKIQTGNLFELTTNQSFIASQLFIWNFTGIFSVRLRSILMVSILMLFINYKIAFIIIGTFILSYVILLPFYNANMKNYKIVLQSIINLQEKINEYIESFSTTKTLRLEEINMNEINLILEISKNKYLKTNKILALHTTFFSLMTFFAVIFTLIIGGNEIIMGIGVVSTVMLLVDYISDINDHMQSLLEHAHGILNKYNAFIQILKICAIAREKDNGIKDIGKIKSIEKIFEERTDENSDFIDCIIFQMFINFELDYSLILENNADLKKHIELLANQYCEKCIFYIENVEVGSVLLKQEILDDNTLLLLKNVRYINKLMDKYNMVHTGGSLFWVES